MLGPWIGYRGLLVWPVRGSQLLTSGCPGVDDVFTPFSFSQLSQQLETPTYNYISTHRDEPGYATTAQLGVAWSDWGQRKVRNITPCTHLHLGKLGWRHVLPMINAAMKEALLMEDVPGTWFYSCKQIYSLFGITWTGQAPCRQTFTSLINDIEKSYIAHWRNSLNSKDGREGKLSTYRKIKLSFRQENYLDSIKEVRYRKAMASFRASAHKLEIEKYRYSKTYIPRNHRICSLCARGNRMCKGDEFHALMVCHQFDQQRKQLFKVFGKECKNFNQLDEWGKFVFMLNSEGNLAAATGKMIHGVISVTRCLPAWTRY